MEIKILDDLLFFFSENIEYMYISEIYQNIKDEDNFKNVDFKIIKLAVYKLEKDGYILNLLEEKEDPIFNKVNKINRYKISFDGIIFLSKGGYVSDIIRSNKLKEDDLLRRSESDALQKSLHRLQKKNLLLTYLIVLGTVVAGVYSAVQLAQALGYIPDPVYKITLVDKK